MDTQSQHEWTHRAKCSSCGCTGPGSVSASGAKFLAVLCGWDEALGMCLICTSMRKNQKPKRVPKPKPKGKTP